ncbi:MAG: ABC transporter permease subunit [Candidatus Micrarchaeia archaeon]
MNFIDRASQQRRWSQVIDLIAILFFLIIIISPVFFIFTGLGNFVFSIQMQDALVVSFSIAILVTIIDLLFGIPLAWLLARKQFPLKRVVDTLVDLPLVIPTSALGLSIALFWGTSGIGFLAPGFLMIVLLHITFTFPYVVRTTQAAILGIDGDLGRAASTLGASPLLSFRTIWLPLFRAGAISGALLAFTRSLGETGATLIVAGAVQTVPILTVYYKNSIPTNMDAAISLSAIFLIISVFIFMVAHSQLVPASLRMRKVNAQAEKRLSQLGVFSDAASVLFLFLLVLLPSFYFLRFMGFDFGITSLLTDSILISFLVAGAATLLSLVFGIPLALYIASKQKLSNIMKLLNDMGMIMPTVTIGLSLSLFWAGRAPDAIILVLAHTAIIFPYFVGSVSEVLSELDENLVQVARSLGASPFYAFHTVILPLAKPSIIAGIVVAFMRSVSETGGTLAVSSKIQTVPLLIVNLSKAGDSAQAAFSAAVLVALALVFVLALRWNQQKKW